MGNRLSQIATRTGDAGTTGLGDNSRVLSPRPLVPSSPVRVAICVSRLPMVRVVSWK